MPGRVDGGQHTPRPDPDLLAVLEHVQPLGGRGVEPAVELVEQVAVHASRRADELLGVGQVSGPLGVDVDRGVGKGAGHVAHPAGVVEVDVGHGHPGQVVGRHSQIGEGGQEGGHRALAARLDEHRLGPLDEVARGDALPAPQQRVDLEHARPDALGHVRGPYWARSHGLARRWGHLLMTEERSFPVRNRAVVESPKDRIAMAYDAGVGRVSIASVFAGTLVAFGATVIFLAVAAVVAAGTGIDESLADASWRDAGTAGGAILAAALLLAYLFGGYTAGRMARRSGLTHGVLVFLTSLVAVAVVTGVARMLSDASTESILRNLRSIGVPTTGDEWRDVVTVAGIGSLVAMLLGSCVGAVWGERWHNRLLARALDPTVGTEGDIASRADTVHDDAVRRVERTRVGGGVDLRERDDVDRDKDDDTRRDDRWVAQD